MYIPYQFLRTLPEIFQSAPNRNQMKLKTPEIKSSQAEWVCFKDSKNILHEILKIRA